jgi:phosphoglycerate dehydrogenase-like enzyme
MSERVKILIPGDNPVQVAASPHLNRLAPYGDITLYDTTPQSSEEKLERAQGHQIILNSRGVVTWRQAEFSALPDLRMLTTCSIGTDMIDLSSAKDHGVVVSNQPGRTAPVVAEHMFGLMFAVAKRAAFMTSQIQAGQWPRRMNSMIQGKTLGIIGTGNIGAEMARLGNAIGMEVIAWTFNPSGERAVELGLRFVELDELLRSADIISLHVALTEDTRNLISADQMAMMKQGSLILNGARGPVVDIDALAAALDRGHLGGAALDVFDTEPFAEDHPIKHCENIILTPHAADQTPEGVDLLNEGAVDNIIAFLEGRPQNNMAV